MAFFNVFNRASNKPNVSEQDSDTSHAQFMAEVKAEMETIQRMREQNAHAHAQVMAKIAQERDQMRAENAERRQRIDKLVKTGTKEELLTEFLSLVRKNK